MAPPTIGITHNPSPQPVTGSITTTGVVAITATDGSALTSTGNALDVNVKNSITVDNHSVAPTGAPVPADATYIGARDNSGNLTGLSILLGNLLTEDAADGPVTPGVVASKSILLGGQFNTVLPTLTNTQQAALQVDSSGRLLISPLSSTSTVTVSNLPTTVDTNYGTVGASTLRSAAQIGNATGAAAFGAGTTTAQVLRVVLPTDQTAIPATQSGTWTVQPGNTANTTPWLTTINQGGNSATVTASNALKVDGSAVTQPISGTVTANAGTGNFTVVQPTGANLHTVVDSGTITISNLPTTLDTNYGTVGANTLRSAAQVGNATGAALFGAGTTTGQVLRVVLPTDQTSIPVTQNTSPWITQDNADGPVTPGAVASKSLLIGGQFNTVLPTLTNTQQAAFQSDSSGRLIISPLSSTSTVTVTNFPNPVDTNYGAVGASTIRTASEIGNATGSAAFGAGTTTAQVLRVVLPTDQTAIPVSQSGSWTVTANAGTNLNTSALALDTTVSGLQVSQGSTTSGEKGPLVQGAVTTSPPTYTTGQTDPLSLTTSGALRVDASGTVQPISGTVTANQGTSPWVENVSQFGGSNVVTGTGNSGAGIPRVTVSNDSSITNITGTISLPTGASTASNQTTANTSLASIVTNTNSLTLAQGSTTSGQTGNLAMGAVTTAAPTYVTGQTDPLSLTTTGLLRVDGSGVTQPVSGTVTANQGTSPWVSNITQFGSSNVVTGVGNSGAGIPRVTISSDSSLTNITGTISLPTGASTAANQTTANTTLASILTQLQSQVTSPWQSVGQVTTAATTQVQVMNSAFNNAATTNQGFLVNSTSANDALAGTGAQVITITYFQADGSGPFTQTVNMNGTTTVFPPTQMCFIQSVVVTQVGSGGTNAGNVNVASSSPFTTAALINAGQNQTYYSQRYIPKSKSAYITQFNFGGTAAANGQGGIFSLLYRTIPFASTALLDTIGTQHYEGTSSTQNIIFPTPIVVPGPALLSVFLTPDSATSNTYYCSFGGYFV